MAGLQIPNPSITSGAFASMLAFSSDNNTITAISGHPIAGVGGGGTPVEGYWRPSVNNDGDISWQWSLESTATAPSTANIKGPQGIQGETGPRGPSGTNGTNGTNGTDGKDATPITATTTTAVGGTQVTISYTSGGDPLAQFTVLSGAKGADGVSPTVSFKDITDTEHTNGGTEVTITDTNGAHTYSAWNGNDGSMAGAPAIAGYNGISADLVGGTKYVVGISGGYYSDTLSAYSAMYAGYASNAKFSDNSVSSMDQIKGSIDWGNQIASEYATHSGDYATSSNQVITGNKQYALTTAGWASVETAYLPLSGGTVSGQLTISGSSFNNNLQLKRGNYEGFIGLASNGAITLKNNANGSTSQIEFLTSDSKTFDITVKDNSSTPQSVGKLYVMSAHSIADASATSASWANDGMLHIILES